jgi:hypothetical protein
MVLWWLDLPVRPIPPSLLNSSYTISDIITTEEETQKLKFRPALG